MMLAGGCPVDALATADLAGELGEAEVGRVLMGRAAYLKRRAAA